MLNVLLMRAPLPIRHCSGDNYDKPDVAAIAYNTRVNLPLAQLHWNSSYFAGACPAQGVRWQLSSNVLPASAVRTRTP